VTPEAIDFDNRKARVRISDAQTGRLCILWSGQTKGKPMEPEQWLQDAQARVRRLA
jgi:hypothetical protein